jgi:hypothetical protein
MKEEGKERLYNFEKFYQVGYILNELKHYQQHIYNVSNFDANYFIQDYLTSLNLLELPKLRDLSRKLEPIYESFGKSSPSKKKKEKGSSIILQEDGALFSPSLSNRLKISATLQGLVEVNQKAEDNSEWNYFFDGVDLLSTPRQPYESFKFIQMNLSVPQEKSDSVIKVIMDKEIDMINAMCALPLNLEPLTAKHSSTTTTLENDLQVQKLAQNVARILYSQRGSTEILHKLIDREVNLHLTKQTSCLFQPEHFFHQSFSTLLIQHYCVFVGRSYISKTFHSIFKKLYSTTKSYDANPKKLMKLTRLVLALLEGSIEDCPR